MISNSSQAKPQYKPPYLYNIILFFSDLCRSLLCQFAKGHMAHLRQSIFLRKPQGKGNHGRKSGAVEDRKETASVILLDARKYTLTQKAQDAAFKPADL